MDLKKTLAIGAVAALSALFNGCAVVPANGYVTGYSTPIYYPPVYPAYGPSIYVAPRVPNWGYNHGWNNNHGWAPRHYAPPPMRPYGGGHYRR